MATKLNNITYLKDTHDHLRKNMTEEEQVLWEVLNNLTNIRKRIKAHFRTIQQ